MTTSLAPTVASTAPQTEAKPSARRFWRLRAAHFFILPYVLLLVTFALAPAIYALLISFAKFTDGTPQFFAAGFSNFQYAYTDFRFKEAFDNVMSFVVVSVPFGIVATVFIALLLHARSGWWSNLMRVIYFVPGAVAGPAVVLLAIFMLDPRLSPFRPLLTALGYHDDTQVIQTGHLPVLFTLVGFFGGAGGWVAIFYGALKGISSEVIEVATVDGANAWQSALYIKLPLISRFVIFMSILTFAGNVQIFTEPTLLGDALFGSSPISATWSLNQLATGFAFTYGQFGAAAALSLLMIAIGLVTAFAIIYGTKFYQTDAAN